MSLAVRNGNDILTMSYICDVDEVDLKKNLAMAPSLELNFDMYINQNKLTTEFAAPLTEAIGLCLSSSLFWKEHQYETSLFLNTENSFTLCLKCNISDMIKSHTVTIHKVAITYKFLTESPTLDLQKYIETFNYLMVSLFLNLEFKFPFVFSFYGRKLLEINYSWIERVASDLTDPQLPNEMKSGISSDQLTTKLLLDLQQKAYYQFNTLKIWRDCEDSRSKLESLRRFKKREIVPDNTNLSSMVYHFRFVDAATIEDILFALLQK